MITSENLQKLQHSLAENEAALILSPANRFYLTGFASSDGFCLLTQTKQLFFTDSRYIEEAKNTVKNFEVCLETGNRKNRLAALFADFGIRSVQIESGFLTVSMAERLKAFTKVDDSDALDAALSSFRMKKTAEEIALITCAAAISEKAFSEFLPTVTAGQTERELSAKLDYLMRLNGADGLSFETIAVTGQNSSKPHGVPGDTRVSDGDFITFDFGASYRGYCSDMTRTVAVGSVTDEMKRVYHTVLQAQEAGLSAIRAGVKGSEADAASREIIQSAGYGENFGHGLGHGVGVEIHELPRLSPTYHGVLETDNVVTCEPGIYLEKKFGVRIEDTVLVTEDGCKPFHKVTKELIIL